MLSFRDWPLRRKITVPMLVITCLLALGLGWVVDKQQRDLAVAQARRTSEAIAEQVRADRQIYSAKVVAKLRADGVDFHTSDMSQLDKPKHIPLPASFVHLTSALVNKAGYHQVDLLSHWYINPEKKPKDGSFEDLALTKVEQHPSRFQEALDVNDEGPVYKRIVADLATEQLCVDCHNGTVSSPKRNFTKGDVMGGLVITLPMTEAFAEARHNAIITTGVLLAVFGILLLLISAIQIRYISRPLTALEQAADKISMGELDTAVLSASQDEVGRLGAAFERMRTSLQAAMKQLEDKE